DPAEDDEPDHAVQAVLGGRVGYRLAGPVGEEGDAGRPDDAAGRIPGEELPPVHPADPGEPRGRDAEHGEEAREEDRLATVALEEPFGRRQGAVGVPLDELEPHNQLPAADPPEPVPDVVTDDR